MKTNVSARRARTGPSVHIALLRGVNVGGKNKLPMRELSEIFIESGARKAVTYIQSGNVIFAASDARARRIASAAPRLIGQRFGFEPRMVLRTADELATVARGNPFLSDGSALEALFVGFLADWPESTRAGGLNPQRSPGDRYVLNGRDIYMHLATGAADTKLTTAYFDSTLGTTSTFRNWRTVLKLRDLARELGNS